MSCSGVLWLKILTFPQGAQHTLFQIASLRAFVTLWTRPQQLNCSLILPFQAFLFEVVSWSLRCFYFQDDIGGDPSKLHKCDCSQRWIKVENPGPTFHTEIVCTIPMNTLYQFCLCLNLCSTVRKTPQSHVSLSQREKPHGLDAFAFLTFIMFSLKSEWGYFPHSELLWRFKGTQEIKSPYKIVLWNG